MADSPKLVSLRDGKYVIDMNLLPDRYSRFELRVSPRAVSPSAGVELRLFLDTTIRGKIFESEESNGG